MTFLEEGVGEQFQLMYRSLVLICKQHVKTLDIGYLHLQQKKNWAILKMF